MELDAQVGVYGPLGRLVGGTPARAALAALYAGNKRFREALVALLEIMRRAKDMKAGEARKQILSLFTLDGEPEFVSEYRR